MYLAGPDDDRFGFAMIFCLLIQLVFSLIFLAQREIEDPFVLYDDPVFGVDANLLECRYDNIRVEEEFF